VRQHAYAVADTSLFLRWADLGRDLVTLVIEALDGFFETPLEFLGVREGEQLLLGPNRQLLLRQMLSKLATA
jgi:hypothetical protein